MGQSHFSPSTTKMGSSIPPFPNSTLSAIVNANCPMTSISNSGASAKIVVSSVNFLTQTKAQGIAHAKRINTRSPALPQPPPYPGQHSSGDLNRSSNLHLMAVPSSSYNYCKLIKDLFISDEFILFSFFYRFSIGYFNEKIFKDVKIILTRYYFSY